MDIEIIPGIENLKEYRGQWQEILEKQNNDIPFIEMDWIIAWWNYFGDQNELFIIMVKEENEILGFLPFMIIKKRGYKEVTFIGNPQASYIDFVVGDEHKERVIIYGMDFLLGLKGRYIFNFYGLFEDSISYKIISKYLNQHKISSFSTQLVYCYHKIHKDFESYFHNRFGRKTRHTKKRKENRLNKLGKVDFYKLDPQHLEEIFRIHDKRWKRKIGNNDFSEGKTEEFFKELAQQEDVSFKTDIDVITLNNRVLAFIYGFTCRGRYTFYRIAHDDDFYLFSPGELVLKEKLKQCFEKQLNIFDFGAGYESYKADWTDDSVNVKTLVFPNHSFLGKMFYKKREIILKTKSLLKKSKTIVNFRKHTLGKIKYKLSWEYQAQLKSQWKRALERQKIPYLIISAIFRKKEYLFFYRRSLSIAGNKSLQSPYDLWEGSINDLDKIADILGKKSTTIVRRLSMGHGFFMIKREGKIILHCWVGINTIEIEEINQRKKIQKKDAMLYDIQFIKYDEAINTGIWQEFVYWLVYDLYCKGHQKLIIGYMGKEKNFRQISEELGFQLQEKLRETIFLGKKSIEIQKYHNGGKKVEVCNKEND